MITHTLEQVRDGTGWPDGARFALVSQDALRALAIGSQASYLAGDPDAEMAADELITTMTGGDSGVMSAIAALLSRPGPRDDGVMSAIAALVMTVRHVALAT